MIYANEWDKDAAHWLSCLPLSFDEIDTRSIEFVKGSDLANYDQCHFFAGIGGWPLALEIAGWPNDARVWTGSCPCQPFSQAGKRKGTADERHLWPEWFRLIKECLPPVIFGEQVSSAEAIGKQSKREGIFSSVPTQTPSQGFGASCEGASNQEINSIQSRCPHCGNTNGDRRRNLPIDGVAIQPGGRSNLGQSIDRSDRPKQRLRNRKCASDLPRCEQCGRRLGRISLPQDGFIGDDETARGVQSVVDGIRGELTKEAEWPWFSVVQADLESAGYAVGACVLSAASCGAPHIRQRLFWVAHRGGERLEGRTEQSARNEQPTAKRSSDAVGMANASGASGPEHERESRSGARRKSRPQNAAINSGDSSGLANTGCDRSDTRSGSDERLETQERSQFSIDNQSSSFWGDVEYITGRDGKARPVKPGVRLLAHGVSGRVAQLRGLGNAIVPQVAAEFIAAFMQSITDMTSANSPIVAS